MCNIGPVKEYEAIEKSNLKDSLIASSALTTIEKPLWGGKWGMLKLRFSSSKEFV